jgi:Xaa-Pro aminopeptidase
MLSHEQAVSFNTLLVAKSSKLFYPRQNFVDLKWNDKPPRCQEPIFIQPVKFTGKEASTKLAELRFWIKNQRSVLHPNTPAAQTDVAAVIDSLSSIGTTQLLPI